MADATSRIDMNVMGSSAIPATWSVKLKARARVAKGWHVAIDDSSGFAASFPVAPGMHSGGLALVDADNSTGADGAVEIPTSMGVVDLDVASSGDALVDADAPCVCYAADNHTVAKTSNGGARSPAGLFLGVNAEKGRARVWVGPIAAFMVATNIAATT